MKVRFFWLNVTALLLLGVIAALLVWTSVLRDTAAEGPPAHCAICARGTPCAASQLDELLVRQGWMDHPRPEDGPIFSEPMDRGSSDDGSAPRLEPYRAQSNSSARAPR
jgi:hypothetical protein